MTAAILSELQASEEELASTFDSTCRFWVHLSGPEFLSKLDQGLIDTEDTRVKKVLRRLDYVRPHHSWAQTSY